MKKRILSALVAVCMTLTMLPAEALAEEWDNFTNGLGASKIGCTMGNPV